MREILFRAKRLDDGEWVEGNLVFSLDADEEWRTIIIPIRNSYMFSSGNEDEDLGFENWHRVDPKIVGQYTGLTDKNGVKIFEGDIVSTDIERPYLIVEFRDGCFMFNCNDGGEDYYDIMLPILNEPQTQYKYGEVVGNIFDNPELMEGGGSDDAECETITNADRIRSMTDKELVEWLTKITNDAQIDAKTKCNYEWETWLSEVAE